MEHPKREPQEESWWTTKICPIITTSPKSEGHLVYCFGNKCCFWQITYKDKDNKYRGFCNI